MDTTQIRERGNGELRRWADHVLIAACGLVLLLTGTVWAVTWRATEAKLEGLPERVTRLEEQTRQVAETLRDIRADVKEIKTEVKR